MQLISRALLPVTAGTVVAQIGREKLVGKFSGNLQRRCPPMVAVAIGAGDLSQMLMELHLLRRGRQGRTGDAHHPDLCRRVTGRALFSRGSPKRGMAGQTVVADLPVTFQQFAGIDQSMGIVEQQGGKCRHCNEVKQGRFHYLFPVPEEKDRQYM